MYPITPEHLSLFLTMLKEVADATELTFAIETVSATLLSRSQGHFSTSGQSVSTPLVGDPGFIAASNVSGIHLVAGAFGIPQGRPGFDMPTLALKIMSLRTLPHGVLFEYDVFADGRRVLLCAGLQLDTIDERSVYEPEGTFEGDIQGAFDTRQELGLFCLQCIQTFPVGPNAEAVRQKIFTELGIGLA